MTEHKIDTTLMARLGDLYAKYHRDFDLRVSHCLTEPTCPTASVVDDEGEIISRADRDTIEEAINVALQIACDRLLDGKGGDIWPDAQGTNPNDMRVPSKYPLTPAP